ncbi:MAG: Peptidylprolyl isomerase, FKBP-type, partial [uncultured Ramlibacter sp.]
HPTRHRPRSQARPARARALHRLAVRQRPARRQVRLQRRPERPVRLLARRRHGDQGLGRGRGRHEGGRQADPHHPAAARLRCARRRRRDPAQRDLEVRRRAARRPL